MEATEPSAEEGGAPVKRPGERLDFLPGLASLVFRRVASGVRSLGEEPGQAGGNDGQIWPRAITSAGPTWPRWVRGSVGSPQVPIMSELAAGGTPADYAWPPEPDSSLGRWLVSIRGPPPRSTKRGAIPTLLIVSRCYWRSTTLARTTRPSLSVTSERPLPPQTLVVIVLLLMRDDDD